MFMIPGDQRTWDDWRLMAIAAISKGFCPNHFTVLEPEPPRGGWCRYCNGERGCWYRVEEDDTVVATYPPPA